MDSNAGAQYSLDAGNTSNYNFGDSEVVTRAAGEIGTYSPTGLGSFVLKANHAAAAHTKAALTGWGDVNIALKQVHANSMDFGRTISQTQVVLGLTVDVANALGVKTAGNILIDSVGLIRNPNIAFRDADTSILSTGAGKKLL